MQQELTCTRNGSFDKDTQWFHATAFQHVASVEPVEQTILEVHQEVPSRDVTCVLNGSSSERFPADVNGVQPSEEVVQQELTCTRNESSDKDTQWFHASAFEHVASVEPAEQTILEVQQEVPSKNVKEKVACTLISVEANGQEKDEEQVINVEWWYRIFVSLFMLGVSCGYYLTIYIILTTCLLISLLKEVRVKTSCRFHKHPSLGSVTWTKRKIYWRRRQLSRSTYIMEVIRSSVRLRRFRQSERSLRLHDDMMKSKRITPICLRTSFANPANTLKRTRDGHVQGDAKIKLSLERKNSFSPGKRCKNPPNGCSKKKICSPRKIGISSSDGCSKSPSKQFRFFYLPKRIKKRIGFRRGCGNALNHRVASVSDGQLKSTIVRNTPRRKKKVCKALRPKLPKPTSTPELKDLPGPTYHISFKKALEHYKTTRKGHAFYPSKRVIWRNRHRLVFGARNNKNCSCQEYQFYSTSRKNTFVPSLLKKRGY